MSADKYPKVFSRQMEAIVYIENTYKYFSMNSWTGLYWILLQLGSFLIRG